MIFDNFSFSILINIFSDYGVMEKVIITFLIRLFLRPNLIKPNQSYILGLKEMPIVYPGCVLEETVWSLEEQERKKLPETPSIIPLSHHVKMLPHDPPLHIKKWKIKIKIKKIKLIINSVCISHIHHFCRSWKHGKSRRRCCLYTWRVSWHCWRRTQQRQV